MLYNGKIADCHMHLWDLKNDYDWLNHADPNFEKTIGSYEKLRHNFLIEDYINLTKSHNITKSVHIEAHGFEGNFSLETKWLQALADVHGFPHGIVGEARLDAPDIDEVLKEHTQYENMRGIRMMLNWHEKPYLRMADKSDHMRDEKWLHGFSLLKKYNLSFDLQIFDHQIPEAIELASAFPNTSIILEHLAWPTAFTEKDFQLWKERITAIAGCPNVTLKLSCIGSCFQKRIPPEKISDYILFAIDAFGSNRCLFGSNFPPDSLFYTFDELIIFMKTTLSDLPLDTQEKIFYSNTIKVYRLNKF